MDKKTQLARCCRGQVRIYRNIRNFNTETVLGNIEKRNYILFIGLNKIVKFYLFGYFFIKNVRVKEMVHY